MKIIAIIPARYESSRLPGKLLEEVAGMSIVSRVFHKAKEADVFDEIIVATDDSKILDHCKERGIRAEMTSKDHISGTDRIAEVANKVQADIFINIQGDEPFIEVECIQSLVSLMKKDKILIGTLCKKIKDDLSLFDYNTVKLVRDINDKVLYFSRQVIPAHRDQPYRDWNKVTDYYQHLGLYGFKKETLLEIVKLSPSNLEISEKLEQLRWLQNGFEIYCKEVASDSFGIDTQEDLDKAKDLYK